MTTSIPLRIFHPDCSLLYRNIFQIFLLSQHKLLSCFWYDRDYHWFCTLLHYPISLWQILMELSHGFFLETISCWRRVFCKFRHQSTVFTQSGLFIFPTSYQISINLFWVDRLTQIQLENFIGTWHVQQFPLQYNLDHICGYLPFDVEAQQR